ncbi:MAG TPA: MBL fold metallo-hydrolase [Stellaceae bacterium]|nr:MBL fold metallo-hydrolase [Stellaceae bacterium]
MDKGWKWQVGDVEISRIAEFELPMFDPAFIYPSLGAERLALHRPWLEPRLLDPASGRLVISIHCFVVKTRRHTILVDACSGNDKERPSRPLFHRQQRPWLERLADAGFRPEQIDVVLCTHLHIDHVGWNTRLVNGRWVPTFPNARYLITRAEWDHWQDEERRKAYAPDDHIGDSVLPIIAAGQTEFVAMDHAIDDEAWVEPTPGHTPGHVCVRVRSNGQEAVMSGDLMHTAVQCAEPEVSSCFCVDPDLSARTRRGFLERFAGRPTIVLPAHFPTPSGGFVEPQGTGFRFRFDG